MAYTTKVFYGDTRFDGGNSTRVAYEQWRRRYLFAAMDRAGYIQAHAAMIGFASRDW